MAKELEQEFTRVISEVTREVTEDVVKNSALRSVNDLNKSVQQLKNDSGRLVKDIERAQAMYSSVSKETERTMQAFNQHIDTWQEQQQQHLDMTQRMLHTSVSQQREMQQDFIRRVALLEKRIQAIEEVCNTMKLQHTEQLTEIEELKEGLRVLYTKSNEQNELMMKKLGSIKIWLILTFWPTLVLFGCGCFYMWYRFVR